MIVLARACLAAAACAVAAGLGACGSAAGTSRPGGMPPAHGTAPTAGGTAPAAGGTATPRTAGSASLGPGIVARVGRKAISRHTLDHWIGVLAVMQREPRPKRPVPRGVVPQPPDYRGCIEYLGALERARHGQVPPSSTQLKQRCELYRATLSQQALELLITHCWVREEAARAGVAVSAQAVGNALRREFPKMADLRRFLAFSRLRLSDRTLVLEDQLLRDRWPRSTLPAYARLRRSKRPETPQMVAEVDNELARLQAAMTARWRPRTRCRAGYVISTCSEYRR